MGLATAAACIAYVTGAGTTAMFFQGDHRGAALLQVIGTALCIVILFGPRIMGAE